jgi:hypothetical protein
MKTSSFFSFLLFLVFTVNKSFAKSGNDSLVQYLFVEWRHWDKTIVLGHFSNNQLKRIPEFVYPVDEIDESKLSKWLKNGGSAALLSFHCMWGQQAWFHRQKYLFSFRDIIQPVARSNIKTVISFIWHSGGLNYKKNWNGAAAKGEPLGKLFFLMNQYYTSNTYIVCHSMGNRFFEGILSSVQNEQIKCKGIILFSADLPADIDHGDFKLIQNTTPVIAVFQHRRDKLLWFSSMAHDNKRLGRSGPLPQHNSIIVYDMTGHVKGFQNHAHLNKKWSKQKMREFLSSLL